MNPLAYWALDEQFGFKIRQNSPAEIYKLKNFPGVLPAVDGGGSGD